MPSPKSGTAGSAVAPADPKQAEDADNANPGEVEQLKAEQRLSQTGKYGSVQTKPYKPPQTQEDKEQKKSWIEIELVDANQKPAVGMEYRITLADGETVAEGTLDPKGFARVDGIEPGNCKVTFPRLDASGWRKA